VSSPTIRKLADSQRDAPNGRPPAGPVPRAKRRVPNAGSAIRILLVDDHPLVREGLKRTLTSMVGVIVVGEAASGEEAVARARDLEPDLVIMDLSLPRMSGIEASRLIKAQLPATRILALTMHGEDVYIRGALEAGVSGYLVKDARPSELVAAIEAVHRGEQYVMVGAPPHGPRK
jgi:two-component system NarL family response regulator